VACIAHGVVQKCIQNFGKLERKKSIGIPRHKLEDNNMLDFKEIGSENMYWINLV
jgi:hypothetical protein